MDIMSILGYIFGFGLVIFGIVFQAPDPELGVEMAIDFGIIVDQFIDIPSVAITIGGTIAALMVSFPLSSFTKIGKHFKIMFLPAKYNPREYIDQIVEFAKEARMNGLLSLEDKLSTSKDPFLKSSLMMVVDSVEASKVKELLEAELDHLDERHSQSISFYLKGAGFAPSFGMIGTLIGLVKMLSNMEDAATIGPAMSVALLTTLYGSLLGSLVFNPMANKLGVRHEEEYLCKVLVVEGVQAIQAGENPKFIEEKLEKLLARSSVVKSAKKGKDTAKAK